MSLTVTCTSCRDPEQPRRVVQWRQGNCSECADSCVARHLEEFPDHRVELSGSISDAPFAVPVRVERLFGRKIA